MWKEENNCLYKKFMFKDFKEAFEFLTRVANLAEKQGHHPHITNEYNMVELRLQTHDAGNKVTTKDRSLAVAIDNIKI